MFENKEIEKFPQALNFTPYDKFAFSVAAGETCPQNSGFNLKVCKVIILGDLCVGKTSLLNRFCYKVFDSNYRSTIGVDFQSEQINILGIPYYLQIWDTAGQERFKCIAQCYYRKAHVIMLVFDLSSIRTLANCKNWLRDALEVRGESDNRPYIFLVGAKKDLLSNESYNSVEDLALNTAKKLNAEFWSVSAKTGENIDSLFFRAAALSFDDDLCMCMSEDNGNIQIGSDLISICCSFQSTSSRKGEKSKKMRF
ncbi:ras-related protein Rab-36-like isoform X2 [Zophobas morio]|uniref:ras-related protein Rab-36-like isoform X2 n=1 Tax=Zophobas morio TaxID=2755281 RepID=UPI003082D9F3